MSNAIMWENDALVKDLGINVPTWIDQGISTATVAGILQGGCASGAYMPAVEFYTAAKIMEKHGDAVLELLSEREDPVTLPDGCGWGEVPSAVLVLAVEYWAVGVEEELIEALEDLEG